METVPLPTFVETVFLSKKNMVKRDSKPTGQPIYGNGQFSSKDFHLTYARPIYIKPTHFIYKDVEQAEIHHGAI